MPASIYIMRNEKLGWSAYTDPAKDQLDGQLQIAMRARQVYDPVRSEESLEILHWLH